MASRIIRPSQIYRVAVSILSSPITLSVRASILRNGVDIGSATQECKPGIPETLLIKVCFCFPLVLCLKLSHNNEHMKGYYNICFVARVILNRFRAQRFQASTDSASKAIPIEPWAGPLFLMRLFSTSHSVP